MNNILTSRNSFLNVNNLFFSIDYAKIVFNSSIDECLDSLNIDINTFISLPFILF